MANLSPTAQIDLRYDPYRHAIIRNAFDDSTADRLLEYHERINSKSLHISPRTRVSNAFYSARIYTPTKLDVQNTAVAGPWGRWTPPGVPKYTPPGYTDYSTSP